MPRRAFVAGAAALFVAALALPALTGDGAAGHGAARGWALLLRGPGERPLAFGVAWLGSALLALACAAQWRGRSGAMAALAGWLVAAFAVALAPRALGTGAWLWAGALAAAWVGSARLFDLRPAAAGGAAGAAEPGANPESAAPASGSEAGVAGGAASSDVRDEAGASGTRAATAAQAAAWTARDPSAAQATADGAAGRRWRPGRRFWLAALGLWLAVALRDRALDLLAPADEVRRTTAGPILEIELLREGNPLDAPVLARADAAVAGYRETVIGPRRYRAAAGADAYFVGEAGRAPRWLVVERRVRPEGFWTRRLRRFMTLRIVDRERGETIATWYGPVTGRDAASDAQQAAAFVRSVLPPGLPAAPASRVALRPTVRIEPPAAGTPARPASRIAGCPAGVRLDEADAPADPDRGVELVTALWTYGLAGGIGSVFCDAAGVTVAHGAQPSEHRFDRIDPAGQSARRLAAHDPPGTGPPAQGAEARLVAVRATRDGLSVRKRLFDPEPPHRAVREVAIDFEPPAADRPPVPRRPTATRRRAERGR